MYDVSCTKCPLHEGVRTVCMPADTRSVRREGATAPLVLFVGEYPTAAGDKSGRPEGAAFRILQDAIQQGGLTNVAFTYATKCAPGLKAPGVRMIRACRSYLEAEVADLRPDFIVPLGNVGFRAVCEKTGITNYAGRETTSDLFPGARIVPLMSPAALINDPTPATEARFAADFVRLCQIVAGEAVRPRYDRLDAVSATRWLREVAESGEKSYSIDLETTHLNPRFGTIRTVALRCADDTVWFEWGDDPALRLALYNLLVSGKRMVAHNAVFEAKWLLHHVVIPTVGEARARRTEWPIGDTLLFHHLLDENAPHGLSGLAKQFTDIGGYDDEVETLTTNGMAYADIPVETLGQYNAGDADVCYRLYQRFGNEVAADKGLARVYRKIIEPAIWVVVWAEYVGRRIDPEAVAEVRAALLKDETEAMEAFLACSSVKEYVAAEHTGEGKDPFNPSSAQQMAVLLKDYAGVPLTDVTPEGQISVRSALLEFHEPHFKVLQHYLAWKRAKTLRNNYLGDYPAPGKDGSGVLGYVMSDGFLYGSYLLHGTATGRLASRSPNLQNFHRTLRKIVRSRFPGGRIVESDYSQLELRLIAWESGCTRLLDAYAQNIDVHQLTAGLVLGKPVDKVTKDERQDYGKRPNFGLTYGAFPKRFSMEFQLTLAEAKRIHGMWHKAYPQIGRYIKRMHELAEQHGFLTSFMGRKRRLPEAQLEVPYYNGRPDYGHENWKRKTHGLLAASNFRIQSLGSDLNTWAASRVRSRLAEDGMQTVLIGLTHDSATYDAPASEVPALRRIIREVMLDGVKAAFPAITVPLDIDIKEGESWGDLK